MNDSLRHHFSMKHMDYMYNPDNNITLNSSATSGDMNATGIAQIMIPQELFLMLGLISLVENILVVVAIIHVVDGAWAAARHCKDVTALRQCD